jgi:hypothetical protein
MASCFQHKWSAQEIWKHLKDLSEKSIIFFDIDDTLIKPASRTFNGLPYNQLIHNIKANMDHMANAPKIISQWRLQRKTVLMDPDWPMVIEALKKNHLVYGLTKMEVGCFGDIDSMEQWRYQELRFLGLEFSDLVPDGFSQDLKDSGSGILWPFFSHNQQGPTFHKGIFMTGKYSKGQTIEFFFDVLPLSIVLIDDQESHLKDFAQLCYKRSLKFQGVLFKGLEQWISWDNSLVPDLQKKYLMEQLIWLEDVQAQEILEKSSSMTLKT